MSKDRAMRRSLTVVAAAGVVGAIAAAPASAAPPACTVPHETAWHSCLSAGHRAVGGTDNVKLTRATPVLVIRVTSCPDTPIRRKVALRTKSGERLARKRVTPHCKNGVIRYRVNLRPDVELPVGTVIRSFWSRLPDEDRPASVKLTLAN